MAQFSSMSKTERVVLGAVGLLAVAAVVGVFYLVVGELSPAVPVPPADPADRTASTIERAHPEPVRETSEGTRTDPGRDAAGEPARRRNGPRRKLAGDTATTRPSPESGEKGTVSGRIVDSAGVAVAGADVSLLQRRGSFLGSFDDAKTLGAASRADGSFRLAPVEPGGRYIVRVRHGSFAEEEVDGVGVKPGEETMLGEIRVTAGAVLSGRVVDTTGLAVPGARVIVESGNFFGIDAKNYEGDVTLSGPDGGYSVRRVAQGSKNVYCWAKGYAIVVRHLDAVPDGGETHGVDFTLVPGKTIAGTVSDDENRPVEGADVYASPVDYKDASRGATKTGPDGRYVLDDLSEGQFHVFASAEGFTRPDKKTVPSGSEGVDFRFVSNGGISGKVLDLLSSAPITSFSVRYARTRDGKPMGFGKRERFESADGTFEIDDVDPGRYVVQVSAEGYATKQSEELEVVRKSVPSSVVIALDHGSMLRGVVLRSSDRAPVSGAVVSLRADASRDLFGNDLSGGFRRGGAGGVVTGEDGRFALMNVSPGEYALDVTHDLYAPQRVEGIVVGDVGYFETPEVLLVKGGTVSGIVRDESGQPDPKAQVTLTGPRFDRKTRTDREGRFVFEKVPPGEYVVAVTMRSGQVDLGGLFGVDDDQNTIIVRDGETANVNP